ncbi:MAG: hypothetical protein M0P39_10235 [Rhodocyclaceae bacterium]|jgi:hypothetical protein|nr:hypothetical protein [Rhodocyclaceae bacterium]
MENAPAPTANALPPLKGLVVLGAVVVVVVAFIMLTALFGNQDAWAGFLFLTYWAGREEMKFAQLPMCAGGALCGLFMAYLLQVLPLQFGLAGLGIAVGVILAAVYCQIMGWFYTAVNVVTMLFLTVGAVPHIQKTGNFAAITLSLVLGILFFSGLVAALGLIQKRQTAS